jgi:hypothetical protein
MTIREHFELLNKRMKYGGVAIALAIAIPVTFCFPPVTRGQSALLGLALGVPFVAVIYIVGHRIYRCPRCHRSLRRTRTELEARGPAKGGSYWQLWNDCPHCHVSFDEPYRP